MRFKRNLMVLLGIAWSFGLAVPALADSRTATVRVSCTILPMIEIATPAASVNTNLGNKFTTSEATLQNQNGPMKVYSVTAL